MKPVLVAEVEFTEWTEDGRLRHPSFKGIREDKAASEVVRERPAARPAAAARRDASRASRRRARASGATRRRRRRTATPSWPASGSAIPIASSIRTTA